MNVHGGLRSSWVVLLLLACQSAPPSKQQGGSVGGTVGSGSTPGTSTNAGGMGGSATNQGGGVATLGGNGGSTAPISESLTLKSATARIGGRHGDQLYVSVEGTAKLGTFASIEITLLDTTGAPLPFFDNDWDGVIESATGRIQPPKKPTTEAFALEARLEDTKQLANLSQLGVSLFDRSNARTEPVAVTIQQQPVVDLGSACDPKYVANRCREGLSCSSTSAKCVAGTAPTMSHAAFHRGTEGPFIRADGADPDEDVILMRVDFLNSADAPVSLDLDGDEVPDSDYLEVSSGISNQNGGYVFVVESGLGFESMVPRVALTAIDSKGNTSQRVKASITTRPTRVNGQSCDLAGFVGCATDTVCLPSPNGSSYCMSYNQAQSNACDAAPIWDLANDPPRITGVITGGSAWEPPSDCVSTTANNRPEAVVKLRLRSAVSKLVLSTAEPETLIDTGIVVLPSCTAATSAALACNDDTVGYSSQVTLTNVAAGDYIVIVEAVQSEGGGFGLSATVQ